MTPNHFRASLKELGLTQAQAAELLGVGTRSVHAYANGRPIPEPVVRLLKLHVELKTMPQVTVSTLTLFEGATEAVSR